MEPYVLKVRDPGDDGPGTDPPESVLSAFEALFREVCRNIVRAELRLQGEAPEELYAVDVRGESALAADTRRFTDETLDYLGGGTRGTWLSDTFPDPVGRKRIASAVLALHSALNGRVLLHGYGEEPKAFGEIDRIWVTGFAGAVTRAHEGGLIGVVVKDPKRRDHWAISNGETLTPLVLIGGMVSRYDVDDFLSAGPVIAVGTVIRDEEDRIVELRSVQNCYTFPGAVFLRGISAEGDIGLVYPLEAVPSHYARTGTWYLKCDDLGIEASASGWDACVIDFHRRLVGLWRAHAAGGAPNPRVAEALDRICPREG